MPPSSQRLPISARAVAAVLVLLLAPASGATPAPSRATAQRPGELDVELLSALEWRPIGPAVTGGRIDDVEARPDDPATIYVGTASGGLWRSRNAGITWEPIFDDQPTSTIGDVALAPSDPNVVWVGSGEPNNRQSSTWGNGVYRSVDGGDTWRHVGLTETHHIGKIVVHPSDPDTAYVAAVGHLWGSNAQRGVFKTADGGASWQHVLRIDDDTGVIDVAMDPSAPETLYAAAYQRRRRTWGFVGGGPGSGIYRTTDGGATWQNLSGPGLDNGLPKGVTGRIGLAVSASRPEVVMAIIEHEQGGVFRSEDRGRTWRRANRLNPRPMYYSHLRIDPTSSQVVYVVALETYVSTDGGDTFEELPGRQQYDVGVHSDHHALWIDPNDPEHLILGGDGGLYDTWDRGLKWRKINNFAIGQFYGIGLDMQRPYWVYGGMQDNHSWRGPSATRRWAGIINDDWQQTDFGDGMYAQPDPNDPNTVYIDSNGGSLIRLDARTGDRKPIEPEPWRNESGEPERHRFDWTPPIHISPHDSNTIYYGGHRLFISRDRGDTWDRTEDLSGAPDRDRMRIMGIVPGPDTPSRHDGASSYGEITTISESPIQPGVLWVGTDDGRVQVSRDGGDTWANVSGNIRGVRADTYVSRVMASRRSPGSAYVTFDAHRDDDFAAYVFRTDDYGLTWESLAADLPDDAVNVIIEHPRNNDLLFLGTEHGVFFSVDAGARWGSLRLNLPAAVPIDDMVIHPRDNDLVLGTHGRSIWVLDDIAALEHLTFEVRDRDLHAFPPREAEFFYYWKDTSYRAHAAYAAPNPPFGAILQYWLAPDVATAAAARQQGGAAGDGVASAGGAGAAGDSGRPAGGAGVAGGGSWPARGTAAAGVTIEIVDSVGDVVRTLAGTARPGLNRVIWDLRIDGPEIEPDRQPPPGPFVLPAEYRVRVAAAGRVAETRVGVVADRILEPPSDELRRRFEFLRRVRDDQGLAYRASEAATALEAGARLRLDRRDLPRSLRDDLDALATAAAEAYAELDRGRGSLRGRLRNAAGLLEGGGVRPGTLTPPTSEQRDAYERTAERLERLIVRIERLREERLPGINRALERQGAEPIWVPPLF